MLFPGGPENGDGGIRTSKMSFGPPALGGIGASFQILDPPQADLRFITRPRRAYPGEAKLFAWRRWNLEPKSNF
jgi:hypothetical protein